MTHTPEPTHSTPTRRRITRRTGFIIGASAAALIVLIGAGSVYASNQNTAAPLTTATPTPTRTEVVPDNSVAVAALADARIAAAVIADPLRGLVAQVGAYAAPETLTTLDAALTTLDAAAAGAEPAPIITATTALAAARDQVAESVAAGADAQGAALAYVGDDWRAALAQTAVDLRANITAQADITGAITAVIHARQVVDEQEAIAAAAAYNTPTYTNPSTGQTETNPNYNTNGSGGGSSSGGGAGGGAGGGGSTPPEPAPAPEPETIPFNYALEYSRSISSCDPGEYVISFGPNLNGMPPRHLSVSSSYEPGVGWWNSGTTCG